MKLYRCKANVLYEFESGAKVSIDKNPSAITIGTYDGLHIGHRKIIAMLTSDAKAKNLQSILITFEPHPRMVLGKTDSKTVLLLSILEEKLPVLRSLGVDVVVVIEFTKAFSETPPEDFVKEFLIATLGLSEIVIGYDHMFGKDRQGSLETLARLSVSEGFGVKMIEEQRVGDKHVSSTTIRRFLESGNIAEANELLGAPYQLTGRVIEGDKRGRTIGFPTANLAIDENKLIPKNGVYVAEAIVDGKMYRAMANIGFRPTVKNEALLSIEVHLLNFAGDLYGKSLSLLLLSRIRDEKKFPDLEVLKKQLAQDRHTAAEFAP
jgi:riboflavin kinase / FMN adenylyltransferase